MGPYGPSNDWDFAQGPGLLNIPGYSAHDDRGGTANSFILTAMQKSGVAYGINPYNGGLLWSKYVAGGGTEWGSALDINDKSALYVATNNQSHVTNHLANGSTWNGGAWTKLDVKSGSIKWQVPTTGNDLTGGGGASAQGAVTFTNRVILGGSYSGYFTAHDAATGKQLWSYNTGKPIAGGPAVFNEMVYWGTGYGTGSGRLFAFSIP